MENQSKATEQYPPKEPRLHAIRFLPLPFAILSLLAALWAGLLRQEHNLPWLHAGLANSHGPLMVCGFLGTLICLERAVALNRWWAYVAPILCAFGTFGLIVGKAVLVSRLLIFFGSLALIFNFVAIVRRQRQLFNVTMAIAAVAWAVGNLLWFLQRTIPSMVQWWVAFLVLTIAGERLELSRLAQRPRWANKIFVGSVAILLFGLVGTLANRVIGLSISGAGLVCLALWLFRFDVARHTIRQRGLPRFVAAHLLAGYGWLLLAGMVWLSAPLIAFNPDLEQFHYDAMLHCIFLGFVFSMIIAHAPIVFPAVTGRAIELRPWSYIPGILLHLSLAIRIGSDFAARFALFKWSGILNVTAVIAFLVAVVLGVRFDGKSRR